MQLTIKTGIFFLLVIHYSKSSAIRNGHRRYYSQDYPTHQQGIWEVSQTPLHTILSNSLEKPVEETQEYIPPQSMGTAVIPLMPPRATPVNAAASNVPGNKGAVFLGSGSLGVVNLGNGAYALGSGSLGYSDNRSQPRPSASVPLYPPLPATPDLIPAAVPSQDSPPPYGGFIPFGDFNQHDFYPSGSYEPITPDRVAFGQPTYIPRRPKITMNFASANYPQYGSQGFFQPPQNFGPNTPDVNDNRRGVPRVVVQGNLYH